MSQKNDTLPLILAFLVTTGLLGGGLWWLYQLFAGGKSGGLPVVSSPSPTPAIAPAPIATPIANAPATPLAQTNPALNATSSPPAAPGSAFAQIAVPSGRINYGGSTTWAPVRGLVDPEIRKAQPGYQLTYVNPKTGVPGTGSGIRMLLAGELDFAQTSRPLEPQEKQQAQQQGIQLEEIPVAQDGIAVAVNPSLPITGLTVDQILGIYTGQIQNWKNLGGPDLAIEPLSRPITEGGTVAILLQDKSLGSDVEIVKNTTEGLRSLAAKPGGIYLASAPEVVPQCTVKPIPVGNDPSSLIAPYLGTLVPPENCPAQRNQLNLAAFQSGQYPLTRNLNVVIHKDGATKEQAGRAYANLLLSDQGQKLLTQAGFVRIR